MKEIHQWQQELVLDRIEKARLNILILKSGKDIKKIKRFLSNRPPKKQFDAKNFCGKLKVDQDVLTVQRNLTNE